MAKENKPHIGIYGKRNVGKSALINYLTRQQVAIVSHEAGTTTDPVKRSFEVLGVGAVIFVDTAGIDDVGALGTLRIARTQATIKTVDLALLVVNVTNNEPILGEFEQGLIAEFNRADVPFIIVVNKCDLLSTHNELQTKQPAHQHVSVSTTHNIGRDELIEAIKKALPQPAKTSLLGDLIKAGDVVLLITPIDTEAPHGRLILPQVTAIRDVLDNNAVAIVVKETEVEQFLNSTRIKPALTVTDSQLFNKINKLIPADFPLTSFSILLARLKGNFDAYLQGVHAISTLKDGDRVLMLENCSHQTSCDDIGRVKIPAWVRKFTRKQLHFDMVQGLDELTCPVTDYALAIQCGGCMVTHKQLINRLKPLIEAGIPVTNYGMAIAYTQGIFERATQLFK